MEAIWIALSYAVWYSFVFAMCYCFSPWFALLLIITPQFKQTYTSFKNPNDKDKKI